MNYASLRDGQRYRLFAVADALRAGDALSLVPYVGNYAPKLLTAIKESGAQSRPFIGDVWLQVQHHAVTREFVLKGFV